MKGFAVYLIVMQCVCTTSGWLWPDLGKLPSLRTERSVMEEYNGQKDVHTSLDDHMTGMHDDAMNKRLSESPAAPIYPSGLLYKIVESIKGNRIARSGHTKQNGELS